MTKLNQVVAKENSIKTQAGRDRDEIFKRLQKPALFGGMTRTYKKRDDEDEDLQGETKKVELKVTDQLSELQERMTSLFDIVATKEWANTKAKANIVIDGVPLLSDVPLTVLLFLEKQVDDLRSIIEVIPTLDPAEDWTLDTNTGLYKSNEVSTNRSKKVHKSITLHEGTEHHPPQAQLVTVDVPAGTWHQQKSSSAFTTTATRSLKRRVEKLKSAIVHAREEANSLEITNKNIGEIVLDYVFSEKK